MLPLKTTLDPAPFRSASREKNWDLPRFNTTIFSAPKPSKLVPVASLEAGAAAFKRVCPRDAAKRIVGTERRKLIMPKRPRDAKRIAGTAARPARRILLKRWGRVGVSVSPVSPHLQTSQRFLLRSPDKRASLSEGEALRKSWRERRGKEAGALARSLRAVRVAAERTS